jgi:hypothetical protein
MNQDPNHHPSRRDALRKGIAAGAGIAIIALSSRGLAQAGKLTKDSVKYTDHGTVEDKDCDDCSQYLPGKTSQEAASCRIVDGAISPHGHCIAFSPRLKT